MPNRRPANRPQDSQTPASPQRQNGAAPPSRPVDIHVGRRIRARRRELGLTTDALAQSAGVAPTRLNTYETGELRVAPSDLLKLRDVLGVRLSYFFHDIE